MPTFRASTIVLLTIVTGAAGQETSEPSIDLRPSRLQVLPLDPVKQSVLAKAVRERDYSVAENLLAEEATRNPKSQPLLLFLADVMFLDGKQLNAAAVLKKAELLGPLDERSRFLLALSYISIGRKNLAIPELEKLAQSNPSNAQYPYWLSRLTYRKADLQQALSYAREAVRLDAKFVKAYDQLGLCYAGVGQNEEAIGAYKTAIRLNQEQSGHWPWPAMNLGSLYLRLGKLDEAEAALRGSLAIEPRFPVAHLRLGQALEKQERWDEAVRELKEAAELDPTYPEPHYVLARIYKRQENMTSAQQELSMFKNLRSVDKQKGITRPD